MADFTCSAMPQSPVHGGDICCNVRRVHRTVGKVLAGGKHNFFCHTPHPMGDNECMVWHVDRTMPHQRARCLPVANVACSPAPPAQCRVPVISLSVCPSVISACFGVCTGLCHTGGQGTYQWLTLVVPPHRQPGFR